MLATFTVIPLGVPDGAKHLIAEAFLRDGAVLPQFDGIDDAPRDARDVGRRVAVAHVRVAERQLVSDAVEAAGDGTGGNDSVLKCPCRSTIEARSPVCQRTRSLVPMRPRKACPEVRTCPRFRCHVVFVSITIQTFLTEESISA